MHSVVLEGWRKPRPGSKLLLLQSIEMPLEKPVRKKGTDRKAYTGSGKFPHQSWERRHVGPSSKCSLISNYNKRTSGDLVAA
eukprot:1147439-Pelagomonas_calceolata.AAC.5